jgi:hypothetical protein
VPLQFYSDTAKAFGIGSNDSISSVQKQLEEIKKQGKTIVFWGGTGKSAAFLNSYKIDRVNYPLVVDSDVHKIGRFVPGTGQEIQTPDIIPSLSNPIIVITTPWRAKDIKLDIERRNLKYQRLLILQEGSLCEYN